MIKNKTLDLLKEAEIELVGFCAFSLVEEKLLNCRAKSRIPKGAKTVICCAFPYKVEENAPENISRYAAVCDYHPVLQQYLKNATEKLAEHFPQNKFEYFVDNSPIPEVYAAACSGIGVKGDNGLLITKKYGSWVFLGEIVTDLEIETQNLYSECVHCESCRKACPKGENECLSALSQKKGELSQIEKSALRTNKILWGCDICAEVCPLNKGAEINPVLELKEGYRNGFSLDEETENRPYMWRTKSVITRNYNLIYKE